MVQSYDSDDFDGKNNSDEEISMDELEDIFEDLEEINSLAIKTAKAGDFVFVKLE